VHAKVTELIKINLFCVRLNKCGLSNNESNRAASIKIYLTCTALFACQNLTLRFGKNVLHLFHEYSYFHVPAPLFFVKNDFRRII